MKKLTFLLAFLFVVQTFAQTQPTSADMVKEALQKKKEMQEK